MPADQKIQSSDSARLFFAAWPPADVQHALGQSAKALAQECGGQAVPARNIHLTLAFLGDVAGAKMPDAIAAADSITGSRFALEVCRVGYWRHNGIVWAGPERCPDALSRLAAQLAGALNSRGFRIDTRPFVPHVTLVRRARRPPAANPSEDLRWPVPGFVLVASEAVVGGRHYKVLREWPLRA